MSERFGYLYSAAYMRGFYEWASFAWEIYSVAEVQHAHESSTVSE